LTFFEGKAVFCGKCSKQAKITTIKALFYKGFAAGLHVLSLFNFGCAHAVIAVETIADLFKILAEIIILFSVISQKPKACISRAIAIAS